MNFLGSEYYRLNRRLLLLVGLWPYEHSVVKYCQIVLCNVIVGYMTVSQIAKLIELRNIDAVISQLSFAIVCFIYTIKYQTSYIVARKIRHLMDHVERDWNMLRDKRELEIMGRYSNVGSMCTLGVTILGLVSFAFMSLLPLAPNILDVLAPLNVSRPRLFLFPGEFFVDPHKYYYAILLHTNVSVGLIIVTLVAVEMLYVTHVLHACGMFRVASYRMDQAFGDRLPRTPEKRATEVVCGRLIEAVYVHKRALEFSEFLWSTWAVSYSILLAIGIGSLVINLFCLFEAILLTKGFNELMKLSLFSVSHVFYLFFGNYVGQILIDHSTDIFQNTYVTQWYGAPVQAQKLLPIILQRSTRSCKMTVGGGMFIPSFEGFATLMSTTVSYFTVLWSVRK